MSTLHHEALLEDCFETAWEDFRVHNKLTVEMMEELCSFSRGTVEHIERTAQKLFDERCQQARSGHTQGRGEQQSDVLWYTLWKTALYVWRPLVLTVTHPL